MLGIVAMGIVRESQKFRAPIGRIARSSVRQHSFLVNTLLLLLAKSKLFWLSRHVSFWSRVSFNFAILINLLVAFFYPFGSNTGGMYTTFRLISSFVLPADFLQLLQARLHF